MKNTTTNLQLHKYSVIGSFLSDTIYIIPPFNNHIRFYNVWPNIPNSRPIVEFLKGDATNEEKFVLEFTADCEIKSGNLIVKRSDFGQIWETSIPLSNIKVDLNFL